LGGGREMWFVRTSCFFLLRTWNFYEFFGFCGGKFLSAAPTAATARTCTAVVCGRHAPLLLLLLMRAVIAGVLGSQSSTMPHYDSAIITLTASITLSYTCAGQNKRQSDTLPSCQLTNLSLGQDHYHHYRTEHFLSAINQGYQ
jgi:hypothetical protein